MEIILYSLSAFLVSFFIQLLFILINNKKRKINKYFSIEKEYNENMKLIIKIIIAIIISIILSIITFFALGIAEIAFLRQGH